MTPEMSHCRREEEVWALDLEWVPDAAAGRLLYGAMPARSEREVLDLMWERGGATVEEPRPYLKTVLCRIVSIAAVRRSERSDGVSLEILRLPADVDDPAERDERVMLSRFFHELGRCRPLLVGFNSSAADLSILRQRAVVHGLAVGPEDAAYFSGPPARTTDLMRLLGGRGGGMPSLHEMATLSGIPGKMGTDGGDVARLWLGEHFGRIADYNQSDAVTTYLLWLRIAHFHGVFSSSEYEAEQRRVRAMLEHTARTPFGGYAGAYLEEWDRLAAEQGNQHGLRPGRRSGPAVPVNGRK